MAKTTTLEMRLKKACADLYKLASSFPETPTKITIEKCTLSAFYTGTFGVKKFMCAKCDKEGNYVNWCDDIPNFTVDYEDLKSLKEPKNIGEVNSYQDKIIINLLKEDRQVSLPIFNLQMKKIKDKKGNIVGLEEFNPIVEMISTYNWVNIPLPPAVDTVQINIKETPDESSAKAFTPGTRSLGKNENVLILYKKNIPKPFINGSESYFTIIEKDEYSGYPLGFFRNETYDMVVEFETILTNV